MSVAGEGDESWAAAAFRSPPSLPCFYLGPCPFVNGVMDWNDSLHVGGLWVP